MHRISEALIELTPTTVGSAVTICADGDELIVASAHGSLARLAGRNVTAEQTLQLRALRTRRPQVVNDIATDERLSATARTRGILLGLRSCLVVPLVYNRAAIGTLMVVASTPEAYNEIDTEIITGLSGFVSSIISARSELLGVVEERVDVGSGAVTDRQATPSPLLPYNPGKIRVLFRPVVTLADQELVGFEALCRFLAMQERSTFGVFDYAFQAWFGIELEVLALSVVLVDAAVIPSEYTVSVNLSPAAAVDPRSHQLLLAQRRPPILEITEQQPQSPFLKAQLEPLRQGGIRLAVEDVGAGFSSLAHVLRLQPDVIKIAPVLVAGIETDPIRRTLVASLGKAASQMNAIAIAEGVENAYQRLILRDLSIEYGQGSALGRPQPARVLFGEH